MSLGENIYRLRTERNMSQGDLADTLGVSRQSVSKWENNSATPDLDKLMKISELFGVTLDGLVGNTVPVTPSPATKSVPEKQGMPGHKIAGSILLCCGFVAFVAFTILGYLDGFWPLGLMIAIPFVLTGTVCMLCKKHTAFACCWTLDLLLWFFFTFFWVNTIGFAPALIVSALLSLAMVVWTFVKMRTGQFSMTRNKKRVWTAVLIIFALIQIVSTLFPFVLRAYYDHLYGDHSGYTEDSESDDSNDIIYLD